MPLTAASSAFGSYYTHVDVAGLQAAGAALDALAKADASTQARSG